MSRLIVNNEKIDDSLIESHGYGAFPNMKISFEVEIPLFYLSFIITNSEILIVTDKGATYGGPVPTTGLSCTHYIENLDPSDINDDGKYIVTFEFK